MKEVKGIYRKEECLDFTAELAASLPVRIEQFVSWDPRASHPLSAGQHPDHHVRYARLGLWGERE